MVVDRLGTTFAALSDPTRRGMIETTITWSCLCAWLDEPFALSQADDFKTYCLPVAGAGCD